jgi:hypothetical protein
MYNNELKKLEKPEILKPNLSKVFYHPLQGDDQFVRTGTIGDGSCLIHALFHAYSEEYANMDQEKRMTLVKKFRKEISREINIEDWKSINNGMVALISFQEIFLNVFTEIYNTINKSIDGNFKIKSFTVKEILNKIDIEKNNKYYQAIFSILDLNDLEKTITQSYEKVEYIDICINKIIKNFYELLKNKLNKSDLSDSKIESINNKFKLLIEVSSDIVCNLCYKKYINDLGDSEYFLDQTHIEILSDKFNFDIYFIDANTRLPYLTGVNKMTPKNRNSVFILWINEIHYEILGRVIKNTNKLTRKFESNDPFVIMINMLYTNPKKFSVKYPKYIHFLPKETRIEIGLE